MTQAAVNNAKVLYQLSVERQDVERAQELFFVTPKLQEMLENPTIPIAKKYDIIEKVFGLEETPKVLKDFVKTMCRLGNIGQMHDIFEAFYRYHDRQNHILRAELVSAEAASGEDVKEAQELLQSKYPNEKIYLTQKVDESLLGGYVIRTLNKEYDRSYEGRLRQLERKLTRR